MILLPVNKKIFMALDIGYQVQFKNYSFYFLVCSLVSVPDCPSRIIFFDNSVSSLTYL